MHVVNLVVVRNRRLLLGAFRRGGDKRPLDQAPRKPGGYS